jgi:hypothetical protein
MGAYDVLISCAECAARRTRGDGETDSDATLTDDSIGIADGSAGGGGSGGGDSYRGLFDVLRRAFAAAKRPTERPGSGRNGAVRRDGDGGALAPADRGADADRRAHVTRTPPSTQPSPPAPVHCRTRSCGPFPNVR